MKRASFAKRVGNCSTFAIEFELSDTIPDKWNEWLGSLWLWAGGQLVGNPAEIEMVAIAFASLLETARETGTRPSTLVPVQSSEEILETVMWARYGEADRKMSSLVGSEKRLYPFEVLPRRTGPFFDGWEAVLVERSDSEQFIFRKEDKEASEVNWPLGTFRGVVTQADAEYHALIQRLLKAPN